MYGRETLDYPKQGEGETKITIKESACFLEGYRKSQRSTVRVSKF